MAVEFRDIWLEAFYDEDQSHKKIPSTIEGALFRKIQILDAATQESDLRIPPGNRFEHLQGNLSGWENLYTQESVTDFENYLDSVETEGVLNPKLSPVLEAWETLP